MLADLGPFTATGSVAENPDMNSRHAVFVFGLPIVVVVGLLTIAKLNQFGDWATSPQTARIALGGSVIVAGGKARLTFSEAFGEPRAEIACKDETQVVGLGEESSESVCGIRVRLKKLDMDAIPPRSEIEVTW